MPHPRMTAAQREALIVDRRADRVSFRTIAAEVGLSHQRVYQIWSAAARKLPVARLEEHRREETELADQMICELLSIARNVQAGARTRVEAYSAIRGWSERKAKLLGLDAPNQQKVTILTEDVVDRAIAELTAQMDAQATAAGVDLAELEAEA